MMDKYKYMTATYLHNYSFELGFWFCAIVVVVAAWWAIGFRWPEL